MAANARVALAVGVSLALHAVALGYLVHTRLDAPASPEGVDARGARAAVIGRVIVEPRHVLPVLVPPVAPMPPAPPQADLARENKLALPAALAAGPNPVVSSQVTANAQVPATAAKPPSAAASAVTSLTGGQAALARFTPATQLSSRPVVIDVGELEPEWLDQIKGAAVATVSVYVEADGSVFHVEIRNASDPRIGEMVRKAFERARFTPGMAQGKNVAARVDVSLDYEQQRDRVSNPEQARPSGNVLAKDEIKKAPLLPPDRSQADVPRR